MKNCTEIKPFKYSSLHQFLDEKFVHLESVSDTMIKQAKQEYRKMYLAWYKAQYKETHSQIQLTLTKDKKAVIISKAKKKKLKVQAYIVEIINQSLSVSIGLDVQALRLSIKYVLDGLEDYLYESGDESLKPIIKKLEEVEKMVDNDY